MEDEIKELLGDNYQEGMSAKDVQEAFNKMLLSSGNYVNKDKAAAEKKEAETALQKQIDDLNNSLKSKMTDEEKIKAAQKEKEAEFEEMRKMLEQSQLDRSKLNFKTNVAEAKRLAGIEDEDNEFSEFISNAVIEDNEKNNSVSKYINSIVKKAYEKGKSDATKDNLGNMGKDGKSSTGNDDGTSEAEQKIKDIIAKSGKKQESYYFKKN